MEDGTASTGGNNDRRKTVSGPFPPYEDPADTAYDDLGDDSMRITWGSQPSPAPSTSPSPNRPAGHKRSFSGNILGRFNFLRNAGEDGRPPSRDKDQSPQSPKSAKSTKSRKSIDDDNDTSLSPFSPVKGESAMAAVLASTKTRKRKGSLRKTALLGGRRLGTEARERKNSLLAWNSSAKPPSFARHSPPPPVVPSTDDSNASISTDDNDSDRSLRQELSYENINASNSTESGWSESAVTRSTRLSLLTDGSAASASRGDPGELSSPLNLTSPVSQASYMSTTDDDDVLTFDSRASSFIGPGAAILKPIASGTSYFPSVSPVSTESLARHLGTKKSRSSPLSHSITSHSPYQEPEPHDYTETEYWGWVILFVTWLTFTVGMGSCLEIWSWAWDVGETPYAPPELEDDETLPIVGYYPALIVLTGVVAWIWITIAWLGMKYFKHAKIEV